jgi:ArsR family transcriptional regulator
MILTVLSARAEPTRLSAVRMLRDGSELCVWDLMRTLGATQSRMSRHMQALKQAGLVVGRREVHWVCDRLNPNLPVNVITMIGTAVTEVVDA